MQKRGLVIVLLLILVIGGFFYLRYQSQSTLSRLVETGKQFLGSSQVATDKIASAINPLTQQAQPYVQELASGSALVASRAATVLGTTTGLGEVASQPATLLEGTAQYARYWYCKQVVDSYEKQYQTR